MIQFMLLMEDIKLFLKGSQSFYSIDSCCDALVGHLQQLQTIDQNDFRSIIQFLDHLFIRQLELSDEIITIMLSIVTNCFKFGDRMNVNCPLSMLIRKLVQSDFFTLSFSTPTTSQNFTNLLYELIQYHNLFLLDSYPSYSILSNIQLTSGLIPSFISILSTSKVGVVQLEELRVILGLLYIESLYSKPTLFINSQLSNEILSALCSNPAWLSECKCDTLLHLIYLYAKLHLNSNPPLLFQPHTYSVLIELLRIHWDAIQNFVLESKHWINEQGLLSIFQWLSVHKEQSWTVNQFFQSAVAKLLNARIHGLVLQKITDINYLRNLYQNDVLLTNLIKFETGFPSFTKLNWKTTCITALILFVELNKMFMQNDASQETLQEIWQQTIPIIEYVLEHIDTISETRLKILNELIVLIAKRLETLPVDTSIMKRWSYLHLQLLHEILSDYTVQSNDFQTLLHQIPKLKVIHQLNCLFLMLVEKSCKTTVLCPILEVPLLLESIFKLSIQWTANETVGWLFVDHMLVEDTTILLKSSSRLLFGSLIKNMRIHQPCRKTMVESMLIPSFNSEAMNRTHRVRYQSDLIDFAAQSFTISIAVEEYSRLLAHIDKKFLAIHIQNVINDTLDLLCLPNVRKSIIQFQGKVLLKELLSLLITISKHFATCDIVKSILQRGLTQSIVNMLKREWETSQDDIVYRLICILADWPLGVLELPVMQYELDWYQWMIMA